MKGCSECEKGVQHIVLRSMVIFIPCPTCNKQPEGNRVMACGKRKKS